MKIRVLLFAQMRSAADASAVQVEVPDGATVNAAIDALLECTPALAPHRASCMTAVGVDYVSPTHVLRDGDELSLIPPVQGG